MSAQTLEAGYWRAYRDFYSWSNILQSTTQQTDAFSCLRHFAYKTAWKKFDPFWDWVIQVKHVSSFTQLLELVLLGKQRDWKKYLKKQNFSQTNLSTQHARQGRLHHLSCFLKPSDVHLF
jgi:hypothetical protein